MSRIVVGCRVGDWGRFDRNVRPHIPASAEMCALGGQTSIAKAYNALLGYCRSHPVGVDALVLLRDNLELIDVDATAQDPTTSPAASSGCHLRRARRLPRAPRAGTHGAAAKHVEEDALHRAVCAHRITLREAQARVTIDWAQPAAAQ